MRAEDFPPCFAEQNASSMRAEDFPPCFAEQNVNSVRAEDFPPCFAEQNVNSVRTEDFPPYLFPTIAKFCTEVKNLNKTFLKEAGTVQLQ